eukprot:UN29148
MEKQQKVVQGIKEYIQISHDVKMNPLWNYMNNMVEGFGKIEGKTFVEFGCGPGLNLPFISKASGKTGRFVAVDLSEGHVDYVKQSVVPT